MIKNATRIIAFLLLMLLISTSLISCNGDTSDNTPDTDLPDDGTTDGTAPDDGNTDSGNTDSEGDSGEIDWDNLPMNGLALIYNGKARFQVVYATEAGSTAIREANNFVTRLRELGVDVADPVADTAADSVSDCEIIIGASVRNRSEELTVSDKYLGPDGRTIKVAGNSVVIAGGSSDQLKSVLTRFISAILGIKTNTKKLDSVAIDANLFEEALTQYSITSVRIGKTDLSEYVVIEDISEYEGDEPYFEELRDFRDDLYSNTGIWLEYGKLGSIDTYEHKIVLRYTQNVPTDRGFAAYVDGGDLYIECSYANAFDRLYTKVIKDLIFDKTGDVVISAGLDRTEDAAYAYYEDFGAVGDGFVNDYQAIYDTHVYANQGGQKVLGSPNAVYYIHDIPKSIAVKTDVDFRGATFRVNDVGDEAHVHRSNVLFTLAREYSSVTYKEAKIKELMGDDLTLKFGDTSIPWLAPYLKAKSLVVVTNANHKDFVRFGANQNAGSSRHDLFIVNEDGTFEEDNTVCFDFDEITQIVIYRVDESPITVENGNFINICCRAVAASEFKNDYLSYKRGFAFNRANSTVRNITHSIEGEPELDTEYDAKYGKRNESYPYYGFFFVNTCYNLTAIDCELIGHTTYYEDKPATESTGGKVPDPVAMGSYDLTISNSILIKFYNVVQTEPSTGLGDSRYWGIMASNGAKNLVFDNCSINRIDAHAGFWNVDVIDTVIGHTINIIGGGRFYLENVTKLVGNSFISVRGDYGGTFRGDITLVNCELVGVNSYNSVRGGSYNPTKKASTGTVINVGYKTSNTNGYWTWDFGYECYMPVNIVLDSFKSGTTKTYLFPSYPDDVFTKDNPLHKTESITFKNMNPIAICSGTGTGEMSGIPVYTETTNESSKEEG